MSAASDQSQGGAVRWAAPAPFLPTATLLRMTACFARGLLAACGFLSVADAFAAGDAALGRELSKTCVVCHGRDGIGTNPTIPHIAGQSEQYLVKQLEDFRAGRRENEQMSIIARDLDDDAIANLAAWYSSIQFEVTVPDN